MSFCRKLYNPYIFANRCHGHSKFQIVYTISLKSLSLKYQRFASPGCKDIGIRKFEFVSKLVNFNNIPARGGGKLTPPPKFFLHNSKSIGLRLLKFSEFSYIPKALPLGLKPGFNTNCLSP